MMNTALLQDEDGVVATAAPHLSYSRVSRYLTCPEQYRLYYIENIRPEIPPASLAFGQAIHQSLAHLFRDGGDPIAFFQKVWGEAKETRLAYAYRDSWESLDAKGAALLLRFVQMELPRLGGVAASEKPFELSLTNLDVPFIGIIDLIAAMDGKRTVIDFKTSSHAYEDYEVALSDQLTAYALAEPDAEQTALCVLVKTKEPRIDWHFACRTGAQMGEFLTKTAIVGHAIAGGEFYRRPGKHCGWCDYLPLCLGQGK